MSVDLNKVKMVVDSFGTAFGTKSNAFDIMTEAMNELESLRARVAELEKQVKHADSYYPAKCPLTGMPFFMLIEDPQGNTVPTYGGPFDSYTIPERDEDGSYSRQHYDHDLGGWIDGWETISVVVKDEGEWFRLEERVAELEAAQSGLTFACLRDTSAARSKRWSAGRTAGLDFAMMELAGEGDELLAASIGVCMAIGRACNLAKKLARLMYGWAGGVDTKEHLAEELADVVICTDLAAQHAGIDLQAAIVKKFNAGSDKHGFPERLAEVKQ